MDWILDKLPVLVVVIVILLKAFAAITKSKKARDEQESQDPAEEQRRVDEVQEAIRRRIAERRGGTPTQPEAPANAPMQRPIIRRAETTELPDPVGGTLRRVFEEVERKFQPAAAAEPPPLISHRRAELERQQQLADQMKALEEARTVAQRRAAHLAEEEKADAVSEKGLRTMARARVMADLRDPEALRRAFVLREVLGRPVGLR